MKITCYKPSGLGRKNYTGYFFTNPEAISGKKHPSDLTFSPNYQIFHVSREIYSFSKSPCYKCELRVEFGVRFDNFLKVVKSCRNI